MTPFSFFCIFSPVCAYVMTTLVRRLMGIILSLSSTIAYVIRGLLEKRLVKNFDATAINVASRFLSIVPILGLIVVSGEPVEITASWQVVASLLAVVIIGGAGCIYSMKALNEMPISVYNTVSNLGIVFTALVSGLILKETPSVVESVMIILIVSLCLSVSTGGRSIKEIVKTAFKNKGLKYVIIGQFLFSLSSIGGRYWAQVDSPASIVLASTIGIVLVQLPIVLMKKRISQLKNIFRQPRVYLLALAAGLGFILNIASKSYVSATLFETIISLKLFIFILLGRMFLNENHEKLMYLKFITVAGLVVGLAFV